jgi:hypothetical protein
MNNPLSFSSLKLDLFSREGLPLKSASGFILECEDRYYLITNRHVLSGTVVAAGEAQDSVNQPYTLKTSLHIHGGEGEKGAPLSVGIRKRITVPLYDANNTQTWIEHSSSKGHLPTIDIVALPINVNLTLNLFSGKIAGIKVNAGYLPNDQKDYWTKISAIPISAIDTDVEYGPADTVHVIGYPFGWAPEGTNRTSTAFWRTSFIACEIFEIGMQRANTFFIDPCAPEGMNGSPVVGLKNDQVKLLGVYSDLSTAEFGANAGLVWNASLLKEFGL